MSKEFETYNEFFEKAGEHYVHPTTFGEIIYPVSVEQLYQHFKSRMIDELNEYSDDSARLTHTEK